MGKYIDAEKLKRLVGELMERAKRNRCDSWGIVPDALEEVEGFIDSLQQEQPELPGIEDPGIPGKDFIPVEWVEACERYGKWKIVKQEQPEVDLEKEIEMYISSKGLRDYAFLVPSIARHFYERGLNARKEE